MKGRITKDGFESSQLEFLDQYAKGKIQIHRDYLAHVFRWQYVVKWLAKGKRYSTTHLLDVGCGYDCPLFPILASARRAPLKYTAVDIRKIREPKGKYSAHQHRMSHTQATEIPTDDYSLIVCFEMLEHVPFEYAKETLKHLHEVSKSDATLLLSTPVFDEKVGMAKNHINEMTREQTMSMLADTGWNVVNNFGTFASQKDYLPSLSEAELELFNKLKEFHHTDVLANFFAPIYPEHSRNNLWECSK